MERALLEELRARLLSDRHRLRRRLEGGAGLTASAAEAVGELSLRDNHPGDLGSETFERGKDVGLRDMARHRLHEVEAALARMEKGTYGHCVNCGRPIDAARLQALPEASCCRRCEPTGVDLPERLGRERLGPLFPRKTRQVGYDAEDAWQDVARHGSAHSHTDAPPGEARGVVQPIEGLVYAGRDAAGDHQVAAQGDRHLEPPATATSRLAEGRLRPGTDRGSRRRQRTDRQKR